MDSLLLSSAKNYEKVLSKTYQLVLGRKGKQTILNIVFEEENFSHLAGLHKLKDISYPTKSKYEIFKLILDENISEDTLKKATAFPKIQDRLLLLSSLKECFSSPNLSVRYSKQFPIKGSKIRWKYLLEFSFDNTVGYLFLDILRNSGQSNYFKPVSIFKKTSKDFTKNQEKYTVLEIREIDHVTNNTQILYKRQL